MDPIEGISGAKGVKKVKITSSPIEESGTPKGTNPLEGLFSLLPGSGSKITGQEAYRQQLAQFFPGGAKPVLKDGVIGFNVSGLTSGQRTQLMNSLQGFIDQIYGPGVITVTEKGGVIGLDATNLEKNDITALAALLLGRTDPGQVTVSQKSLDGVRNDAGLIQISVQSGTTPPGGGMSGTGRVQVPAPTPGAGNRTPAEWTRLAAILSVDTNATMQEATVDTLDAMSKLQQAASEENIKQMKENFQKMREAAEKAATWGIFSKIANYVMIAIGALLIATGVGAGLGAALLIGGIAGLVFAEEIGQAVGAIMTFMGDFVSTVANAFLDAYAYATGADVSEAKAWVEKYKQIIGAVVLVLVVIVAVVTGAVSVAVNIVGSALQKIIPRVVQQVVQQLYTAFTNFLANAGKAMAEKIPQVLLRFLEVVKNIVMAWGNAAAAGTNIVQAGYGAFYNYAQGELTLEIGKGERKQISLETFIDQLSQSYGIFSKELSKIMDQMTTSISNATSVLQQEGNYASSYKVRTA